MARSGKAKPHDDRDYVAAAARRYGLTPRMTRSAQLLFEGASIEGVARRLGRSLGTIKACGHEIYLKMDVHTRVEFVKRVYEAWIDEEFAGRTTGNA